MAKTGNCGRTPCPGQVMDFTPDYSFMLVLIVEDLQPERFHSTELKFPAGHPTSLRSDDARADMSDICICLDPMSLS